MILKLPDKSYFSSSHSIAIQQIKKQSSVIDLGPQMFISFFET